MTSEREFFTWDEDTLEEKQRSSLGYYSDRWGCETLLKKKVQTTNSPAAPAVLAALFDKLAKTVQSRTEIELKVGLMEKVVLELRYRISELENYKTVTVAINTLAPEPLILKQPIWITVQPVDDEFCAIFFDANINATGDTKFEAIENLKDLIVSNYNRFSALGEKRLGPGPRKQLAVMESLIEQ